MSMQPDETGSPSNRVIGNASQFFATAVDRRFKVVTLPSGRQVRIRSLRESEKARFEASVLTRKGEFSINKIREQRARLIIECVVDQEGRPLFSEEHLAELLQQDGAEMARLYDECRTFCGFDEDAIEELAKNSSKIGDAG